MRRDGDLVEPVDVERPYEDRLLPEEMRLQQAVHAVEDRHDVADVEPVAGVLGAIFLAQAHALHRRAKDSNELSVLQPMKLFHASNLYLSLLFVAVAIAFAISGDAWRGLGQAVTHVGQFPSTLEYSLMLGAIAYAGAGGGVAFGGGWGGEGSGIRGGEKGWL